MSDVPERPTGPPEPFGPGPSRPTSGRSRPAAVRGDGSAVAVAGVVALLAAAFGVASLAQGDGAASAEGAVEDLFDAIADEDAIGVMQAITPAERSVLRPAVEGVAGRGPPARGGVRRCSTSTTSPASRSTSRTSSSPLRSR